MCRLWSLLRHQCKWWQEILRNTSMTCHSNSPRSIIITDGVISMARYQCSWVNKFRWCTFSSLFELNKTQTQERGKSSFEVICQHLIVLVLSIILLSSKLEVFARKFFVGWTMLPTKWMSFKKLPQFLVEQYLFVILIDSLSIQSKQTKTFDLVYLSCSAELAKLELSKTNNLCYKANYSHFYILSFHFPSVFIHLWNGSKNIK